MQFEWNEKKYEEKTVIKNGASHYEVYIITVFIGCYLLFIVFDWAAYNKYAQFVFYFDLTLTSHSKNINLKK